MKHGVGLAVLFISLIHCSTRVGRSQPATNSGGELKKTRDCLVSGRAIDYRSKRALQYSELEATMLDPGLSASSGVKSPSGEVQAVSDPRRFKVVSGVNGDFCFESLPPGQYQLSARRAGFLTSNYGATSPFQSSAILDIDAGRHVNVDVQLMPYGVISGRVIDRDGELVDSGMVQVLAEVWRAGVLRTTVVEGVVVDDLGQYRVGRLPPGTYYVRFRPGDSDDRANVTEPQVRGNTARMVATYHPSAGSLKDSVSVRVGLGEEASNIDILVHRFSTYIVRGKMFGDQGHPPEFASIDLLPVGEEPVMLLISNSVLGQDGAFVFAGVAPGEYDVVYHGGTRAIASAGRTPVSVVDRDVVDVLIQMETPVTVNGTIVMEGPVEVDLKKVHVGLESIDSMRPSYGTFVRADGSFVLEGCSPGRYEINVMAPAGTYLKTVRYGDSDITQSPLVIGASGPELKIALARGGARLRGRVARPGDGGGGSAYYLIVRRNTQLGGSGLRFGHTDNRGVFFIKDLQPGSYRVFGFVTLDPAALASPKVHRALESVGTDVELKDNVEITVATPLISAEEGGRIFSVSR